MLLQKEAEALSPSSEKPRSDQDHQLRERKMEEYTSTKHHPASLDLRGHFHLESEPAAHDPTVPPDYPMNVFPITDEQAILVRAHMTVLIDLPNQETLWSITCPALEAALDVGRNRLALGAKGWVYIWDLQSGSLTHTFALGGDIPTALAFHPQGLFLAVAPYADDIQLWRLSDGQLVQSLSSEEYAVYNDCASYKSVAFSPDGQFLADGNFEAGAVWLWHMPSGEFVQQLLPEEGRVQGLAFSPDSQLLVCGEGGGHPNDREMRVWNMRTRQAVHFRCPVVGGDQMKVGPLDGLLANQQDGCWLQPAIPEFLLPESFQTLSNLHRDLQRALYCERRRGRHLCSERWPL